MTNFYDKMKVNDIGNLRTGTGCELIEQPLFDYSGAAFAPPSTSYKGFPTTGLLSTPVPSMNSYPSSGFMGSN